MPLALRLLLASLAATIGGALGAGVVLALFEREDLADAFLVPALFGLVPATLLVFVFGAIIEPRLRHRPQRLRLAVGAGIGLAVGLAGHLLLSSPPGQDFLGWLFDDLAWGWLPGAFVGALAATWTLIRTTPNSGTAYEFPPGREQSGDGNS
ncbi:MAG TPA: hypothetical protein VIO94_09150 [Phenylobacterium sp.]